MTINSGY